MKSFLIAAGLLISALIGKAQPYHVSPQAIRQLDSLFHYLDSTGYYNGNILVASGGKKVASASIGYANLTTHERLTEASPFELASVSKQFTAVGILRLVAAGKLRLDQKVETILPAIPYKGVSIRNLLNHTSGVPDYEEMMIDRFDRTRIATNKDVLDMLIKEHPKQSFAPGAKWEYSNTGYALLALIIEKVSGQSYANYLHEQVFKPMGLQHTFVYMRRYAPKQVPGYAYGYVADSTGAYKLPDDVDAYSFVRYLDGIGGDGSVNSTLGDLLIWNNAVKAQKLLSPALWKEATTPPTIGGKSTNYGMGWEITTNPERGRVMRHTGGWPGYVINNVIYLDKDIYLTFLSNKEMSEYLISATHDAVRNIVFGKPFKFPEPLKQKAVAVDKGIYIRYVGTYASDEMPGFELTITNKDGQLYAQATGQGELKISPESETMFFVNDLPIKMEFKGADSKHSDVLLLHQNGEHEFKWKK